MILLASILICAAGAKSHALGFEELYSAPLGGFDQETVVVVADEESFGRLWGQVMGFMMDKPSASPHVDFSEYLVVAYFPGARPTLGFRFEVKGLSFIEGKNPTLLLRVSETPPEGMAAQMISHPLVILKVSKTDAPKGWWEKDFRISVEK